MDSGNIKLKEYFNNMSVQKGSNNSLFQNLSIPSYIRDWFIMRYADSDGSLNKNFALDKIKTQIPGKDEWKIYLDEMINDAKSQRFLAKIKISMSIKDNSISFALPDLDVNYSDTLITKETWNKIKSNILGSEDECWGVITLKYTTCEKRNYIELVNFASFRPYKIDLNAYKELSQKFSFEEWVDVILGAMDYNPNGYPTLENKITMICRLIPFCEKRVNIIELAPKGTGKSYVYSQISQFGWLNSGGVMSRAKLFYDMRTHTTGLVGNYDFVALDEISTIRFTDMSEMQGSLKGYLESGQFAVGAKMNTGDAGVIFLGNIKKDDMDIDKVMVNDLPDLFKDSALLDRIHGFIEGWKIPRMDESMKAQDIALNCEYFSEILHLLRDDVSYDEIVNSLLDAETGDTRDINAIKRLSAGLLKLLFPYVKKKEDVNLELFDKYCLSIALNMRGIIKKQLALLDNEYVNKPLAKVTIKVNEGR